MAKKKSPAELKEEGASLGEQITLARKRAVNFALQIGKDGLVLETDIKKNPEVLWRNCKKNGGGPKGAMGTMNVRGKVIELTCLDDSAPNQLPKLAKKWLSERGQAYKVVMMTPSGAVGDEDDDEEAEADDTDTAAREDAAEEETTARDAAAGDETEEDTAAEDAPAPQDEDTGAERETAASEDGPGDDADDGTADAPGDEAGDKAEGVASTSPPLGAPVKLGAEPSKRDIAGEFNEVRKDLMKMMGQLEGDVRSEVQSQIAQFGELMKGKDFSGAQRLMDDLAAAQGTVTDSQRGRARDDVAQIDTMVGDVEAELDALEDALKQTGTAA